MAAFDYVALDQRGRKQKGVLEADSARQVRQLLRDKGWMPLEANQAVEKKGSNGLLVRRKGLSVRDLALITRQIATLVQSGIPIEETLTAVASQSEKPAIRSMILAIRSKVMEGFTLADSLAEYPGAFPKLYRSTVAAGEAAGHLDLVLNRLADYTESRQAARQKIQLAAIYPIILSVVAIAIVVFLLTYVVPDIIEVFINNGQALPPLTQGLLNVSDFLAAWGGALAVLMFLAFVVFRYMLRKKSFRFAWHKQLLMMPFVKKLSRGTNTAQFASTLSILTSSGVPLVEAMKISSEVLGNDCLKGSLQVAAQQVSEGASLHKALDNTGYFPP
ncbi:type II secretion system protein GspF, partial [Oleiphilus sp. HI0065]